MTMMLLEWIATSMFLILVVLGLRAALGKRISAGLRYALWAVVLVRLLVPVQLFTSPLAGTWMAAETRIEDSVAEPPPAPTAPAAEITAPPAADKTPGTGTVPAFPEAPALPGAPESPAAPDLSALAPWLGRAWLAGAGLAALVLLASNLRFYGRLRRVRIPLEGADCPVRVYVAVGLPSPCLFGVVRPAVYVTPEAAADPAMLRHVLAHEYTHYRQGDHVWSALRCAALAVHWWNPLVWLAVGLSRRDAELACDEGALRRLGDGERAGYGNTLLALVTAKPGPADLLRCATTMAGDKKSLKERITRIAQAPRRWLWAAVAVVLVTALACACAFGQAEPEEEADALPWPYGVSQMTYIRDAGGFGGEFSICLKKDGTFTYYEGYLSSYIGMGTWTQEDGVICLADEGLKGSAGIQNYYFAVEDGNLIFQAEGSAKFIYVDVRDGERFTRRADDLRFSMDESGNVAISGTVDGLTLGEGTYWHPAIDATHPITYLAMEYPPFTDGITGRVEAWWGSDERTTVMATTSPMAAASSYYPSGYWTFTVEFSGEQAAVTEMQSHVPDNLTKPMGEPKLYPASISDEEAVRVARIAARLLTAAEEWYNSLGHESGPDEGQWTDIPELLAHFTADTGGVPEVVIHFVGREVMERYDSYRSYLEENPLTDEPIEFDGWRVRDLIGPWHGTAQGMDLEVWRLNYEFHTTMPELAENLIVGGNDLTADGWLRPTYPNSTYAIFLVNDAGKLAYLTTEMINDRGPDSAPEEFYEEVAARLAHKGLNSGATSPENGLDREGVPEDVAQAVEGKVQTAYNEWRGDTSLKGTAQFDAWRVTALDGPWQDAAGGMVFEIWRVNYELHTTTPERVKVMSGMALDEEGWFRPHQPDSIYLLFTLEDGARTYLTDVGSTDCGPGEPEFHRILEQTAARIKPPASWTGSDVDRDGVPETIKAVSIDGGLGRRVEIWEGGELLYSEEGYYAHAGWNALFLCKEHGREYLLRYHPTMYQGGCSYTFELFTLRQNGEVRMVREGRVEFDINFQPWLHGSFDPEGIADFMDDLNTLLSGSVQLLNTDENLLGTFEREGRLYDSLWWLDAFPEAGFTRDPDKSLRENLRAYQAAMEAQWSDPWGLTLTAGAPSPTGVILHFIQAGGAPSGELTYGAQYWLEREDEGNWVQAPTLEEGEVFWTLEAYSIPMGGQRSEEVDWSRLYGELPPGHYRICKEITDFRSAGDYDNQIYRAEFFVG